MPKPGCCRYNKMLGYYIFEQECVLSFYVIMQKSMYRNFEFFKKKCLLCFYNNLSYNSLHFPKVLDLCNLELKITLHE